MRGRLLQRFVMAAAALAMVAGVWFLPRAVSSGVSAPPESIELRSGREAPASEREPPASPEATPEPTAPSRAVDDRRDDADDGQAQRFNRAELRTSRESVPDSTRADDDGGDDEDDDDEDDGDDDEDDD